MSKKIKTTEAVLHAVFPLLPVAETCQDNGVEWEGEGVNARVKPCEKPTVGNGLFCDPDHRLCSVMSVCEKHARGRKPEVWYDENNTGWSL